MIRLIVNTLVLVTTSVVAQSPLETTFTNPAPGFVVTNTPSPITGLFDITVTEPQGIVVTQIDLQVNQSHGVNGQFAVWLTAPGGSHVGNEQNPLAWTLASTATQQHNGGRVSFQLQQPIPLAPNTYGVAFHCIEANPVYHGSAASATLPQVYSNNELSIDLVSARVRRSDPVDPFGGTSNGFAPRQLAIGIHYSVGSTSVDFTSDVTGGASPLTVQFQSISTSTAAGGIQAWVWDFDNDGVPDSTGPNPTWTFTACGSYTVSHTIVDITGTHTETKVDYIVTDIVTPGFTNEVVAPRTVQFTDTSTPTPTSWAWDFDNDGTIDSTAQNPVWVFANGCDEAEVSLTVGLACQPPVTLQRPIAVATSIETTFQGGLVTSSTATSAANFFDVDVASPKGITVCGLHVRSGLGVGLPLTVNLYQTEDSYVGKTDDASQWRLVASETVNSAGAGNRTFVPLSTPLHLAQGTFGICMEHVGASPSYTNLGQTLVVGNSDVTITAGLTQEAPIFDGASTTWSPRIANIALHYSTTATTGAAGYGYIGFGCDGSLGVPGNVATSQPVLGGTATIEVDNLPLDIAVMALGAGRVTPPLDLTFVGINGCLLHHTGDVMATIVGASNKATFSAQVPNNLALVGMQIYTQAASLDIGLNPLGFAMSDAAVLLVGQ